MVLFPDLYYEGVPSIKIEDLKKNNIEGIAIDVDNTLIDYKKTMAEEIKTWVKTVKNNGIKICILSNSNKKDKISEVAKKLEIDYFLSAKKPLKKGFRKIMDKFALPAEKIAVIGDQVFTDVWGANRMNMLSIYVKPINKKEHWYTRCKRPFEAIILKVSTCNKK